MTKLVATIDEKQMIAAATEGYELIREHMTAEASCEWLETNLKDFLRQGLIEQLAVIDAANEGNEIAHRALVCVFAELPTPPAQLRAYVEKAALRGPPERKAGRFGPYDHWRRDIGLMVLAYGIARHFGLTVTRNRESRRAQRPSGVSVVVETLERIGVSVSESRLNNLWGKLGGSVTDYAAVRFPYPSIPPG